MSVFYKKAVNTGKLSSLRKLFNTQYSACKCLSLRHSSDVSKKFISFEEVVAQRRVEARRSLVVQVNSEASFSELYGYCSKYASINGVHHYRNAGDEHFMLIEFSSEESMRDVVSSCTSHQKDIDVMALQSPFLWFRASNKKEKLTVPENKSLLATNNTAEMDDDALLEQMTQCGTVSEQIQLLYDKTVLNDLGVRLRFMVARQLEDIFKSLYANVMVRPFGSSVNGFGKMGCDLDLVLTNNLTDEMCSKSRRLVYQEKKCEGGRSPWARHLELVGELLELRVPGVGRPVRVLHARVPILKYHHHYTALDVDMCYNNVSGVYMSELLFLLCSLDARVRPLTFAVRRWARAVGLTSPHPGKWVTSFPLTLLVLFFLQQRAVLPPVNALVKRAGKEDVRIAEENLNCTFLRDMNQLPPELYGQNSASLETLLLQFFEFYAQFDFQDKAVSIHEGGAIRKPNTLPLYIVNPLEQALNVSRNVSYEECEKLKMEVRNAAWHLEGSDNNKAEDWGLLGLIEQKATRGLKKLLRVGNSHRLVSVKDLFKDDEEAPLNGLRNKLRRLTQKSDKVIEDSVKEMKDALDKGGKEAKVPTNKFKNSQVASEVFRIRRNKMV